MLPIDLSLRGHNCYFFKVSVIYLFQRFMGTLNSEAHTSFSITLFCRNFREQRDHKRRFLVKSTSTNTQNQPCCEPKIATLYTDSLVELYARRGTRKLVKQFPKIKDMKTNLLFIL
uniref:(northern house mosquito) hypothetical protein n=1 Tax=Culex pipiens TaxID=7175 RepID=A0A8D8NTC7_CULPI